MPNYYTLPQLNTQGPDLLGMMNTLENMNARKRQMNLAEVSSQREEKRLGMEEKRLQMTSDQAAISTFASALGAAAHMKSPEAAKEVLKQFEPMIQKMMPGVKITDIDVSMVGDDIEYTMGDGTKVKGPRSAVAGFNQIISENPDLMSDPKANEKLNTLMLQKGVSITKPTGEYKPKTKEEALSFKEEEKKIEAKYRKPEEAKPRKAYLTPANTVEYLPNNVDPPEGWVPYQQGIEFETTDPSGATSKFKMGGLPTKPGQGRVLPAEEAGKLGEARSYTNTMEELKTMVQGKKIDTGPLEFIKEKWDNWTGLGPKERLRLRAITARLPGVLYSMRGKQLSDKELEVGMKMMPKMNTQEEVFANDLSAFEEYISMTREERVKAFADAGYRMDKFDPKEVDTDKLKQSLLKSQRKAGLKQYYEK